MREKSGAGASVSSGASYQARVGAYVIACQICGAETAISPKDIVTKISFETMEDVDDINIHLKNGSTIYIQAKAIINFSISTGGELNAVLDQFQRQSRQPSDRLILATTSRSSKKVTYDLRSALEAYRHVEEKAFYKTQPKTLSKIIDEVKIALHSLGVQSEAHQIIKAMSVLVLDIEESDPLDQAMALIIQSHGFIAPGAIWGKLISDCVTFSKNRRTADINYVKDSYKEFISKGEKTSEYKAKKLIDINISGAFSAGREILICESDGSSKVIPEGLCLIEFYRFDDDCKERLRFSDDQVTLSDGTTLKLLRRSATFEGINRLAKRDEALVKDRKVIVIPANLLGNIEESPCAKIHQERIKRAADLNTTPLTCLHCGRPVFSPSAHVIELAPIDNPVVGLTHDNCLQAADRILGTIKSDMLDSHSELIDFDVTGWFEAIHGGQMVFTNAEYLTSSMRTSIVWGGSETKGPTKNYMIEISLLNGEREIVTRRNGVDRFSKEDADSFTQKLNSTFAKGRADLDPFCYSDESKTFGQKSLLLSLLGVKEKFRPIDQARVRKYDANIANRFSRPGHWYAPVFYLRNLITNAPISEKGAVFLMTNPLSLKSYLENWKDANIEIGSYAIEVLLTDREFDEFMQWSEDRGFFAIVNPIFDSINNSLISGRPLMSADLLIQLHSE